jgi:hypothetical protein
MNLRSIAQYLEAASLGSRGLTIFITEMPSTCKEGILLMDRYSGSPIDHELPGWRDTGFGMVVRSAEYDAGYALASRASIELTIQQETDMEELIMRQCLPYNEPRPYRRSVGGFWEFEVDLECTYISKSALANA